MRSQPKPSGILSSAEHEEFCVNLPGPSGKAKYSRETDSRVTFSGKVKNLRFAAEAKASLNRAYSRKE